MNIFVLLAIVFSVFIALDLLSAKLLKIERTTLRNLTLVTLCLLATASGIGGTLKYVKSINTTNQTLYNAYSYLLEGNIDLATENAKKVQSPHSDMILLFADCWDNNYANVFIRADDLIANGKLNDALAEQANNLYTLSRRMTGLDETALTDAQAHNELTKMASDCFSLLKISEKSEVEFLLGFKREHMINNDNFDEIDSRMLSKLLLESPHDNKILRYSVKYYNAMGKLDKAEENAWKLLKSDNTVDNIVLYTDIIAQKLLNDNTFLTIYDEEDKEIISLLEKAEIAEEVAGQYDEDNPRYEDNLTKAAEYRKEANSVKVKRIINWLTSQTPLFGDQSGVIELQLSKLYAASGEDTKARKILLNLMDHNEKISKDSSIKQALKELSMVYYDKTTTNEEITTSINEVLCSKVFLPDSMLNRGFSHFLNDLFKYERVSMFISRVDADNYPTVRAYLNVSGKNDGVEELANDFLVSDFTFVDNSFEISDKKVSRIMDDASNHISIALVIDGSGSMGGSRIQNARHAVEACISNMDPEMQELSILMYENNYHELSPLTNEIIELRTAARQIGAHGGTNISAGLYGGIESLKNAVGTKAIILMTDGEDGNPSEMPNAINAAKAESIAVFTVSMGGGDHNYMQNIANETGGSFMEAVTDEELVKVYTALQNYIVNNYCFEYTVENDNEANPRILTIELKEHKVSSTRTYSHSKLILTEDESYITRTDHTIFRLRYAEPSVVSVKDAELGVPVFINADGVIEGTKVFINGNEIKDIKVIDNMAVSFVLRGKYDPGNLDVTFKLPNGTSKTTSKLLSVSDNTDYKQTGQTIVLGRNGNTIYADKVEKIDDYTLKLSGNVILNGFVRTTSIVTVHSSSPISSSVGRIILTSGEIYGSDAAYIDFRKSTATNQNYGQKVFGGESVKVLELYSFYFDKYSIGLNHSDVALNLPGFGEVYAYAQFDGTEFTYTINKGCTMSELQNNLNYAINSIPIPLPQNEVSNAVQVITGLPIHNDNIGNSGYGLNVQTDNLNVTICDEFANIIGTCAVNGYLGLIEITNGNLSIDTTKTDVMYELSGMANFTNLQNTLKIDKQTPIVLKSYGLYPDSLSLNATGLSINASELSECFNNNSPPKPLESAISVNHPLNISNEPYKAQISSILSDISLDCDRIEFICTDDREQNGLKAFDSSNPDQYIRFTQDRMIIPINAIDELSLFGSDLGGEISGSATIKNNLIDLNLIVDGHLDNPYYSIRHDGRANIAIQLPRNTYAGRTLTVTVSYGKDTLTYDATTTGNIVPQDGFTNYAEDYEQ